MSPTGQVSISDLVRSLSGADFERACAELLKFMGFFNVQRLGDYNDRDTGRDIEATYPRRLPSGNGQINERWFFECKHQKKNLTVEDIYTKIAWATAEDVDFLVFLSLSNLTSSARQFVSKYKARKGLCILAWSGDDLLTLFQQNCRALVAIDPGLLNNPSFDIQVQAEERVRLARNILDSMEVTTPDLNAAAPGLLEELISKCVRREDIQAVRLEKQDDRSSELVYLLSARGNSLLDDSQICAMLTATLERHPGDRIAWQAAKYLRSAEKLGKRTARFLVVGPVCSGKSCLLSCLFFEMLRNSHLTFETDTILDMADMHRSMRDGRGVDKTQALVHGFKMNVSRNGLLRERNTCIEVTDAAGEIFYCFGGDEPSCPELERFVRGDIVLLVFDPTNQRSILHEHDDGSARPSSFSEKMLALYEGFLKWAGQRGMRVVPVITKTDLVDAHELETQVVPRIMSIMHATRQPPIFTTSVLYKCSGVINPQSIGVSELLDWVLAQV